MKSQKRLINIIITSIIIVTTLVSFVFYLSRIKTEVKAEGKENPSLSQSDIGSVTPTKIVEDPLNLSQTIGDITITVKYAKVIPTGVEIGICYTTIDGGEWYFASGPLLLNGKEIKPDQFGFTTEIIADASKTGERCGFVQYLTDGTATNDQPIGYSVSFLHSPAREMYTPCQELQQRIDTSSKAQAAGVKIKCTENIDGKPEVQLTDFNPSSSQETAQQILDQIVENIVPGPWEFTIDKIEN